MANNLDLNSLHVLFIDILCLGDREIQTSLTYRC